MCVLCASVVSEHLCVGSRLRENSTMCSFPGMKVCMQSEMSQREHSIQLNLAASFHLF